MTHSPLNSEVATTDAGNHIHIHYPNSMSFILVLEGTGTIVGPFATEVEAREWAENSHQEDWDITILVPPAAGLYVQRIGAIVEVADE